MARKMTKTVFSLTVLLLAMLFQGCSGTKPYPKQNTENISVTTKLDSGSLLSSMNAYLHVYAIDATCKESYLGTISLDNERTYSGVEGNKDMKFYVVFSSSSFLPEGNGAMGVPVNVKVKKGYTYEFDLVYADDIYNVDVFEIDDKTKKRQKLDFDKAICKS